MKQEKPLQGRIFQNAFLERLTKSNPRITIAFYTLMICGFLFLNFRFTDNDGLRTLMIFGGGLATWTLMEYILHRYLFHIDEYFPSMKRLHYILHGVHHEHPRDHERLFMPPVPGLIISSILLGFFYLFLGENALAFMAGITNGYLLYSYIHYSVHTRPVYEPLRILWRNHAMHHYKHHDKAYGVSSPFWDFIFGTLPPKRAAQDNTAKMKRADQ